MLDRRTELVKLVGPHDPGRCVQFSDAVLGGGSTFFDQVSAMDCEGIVSKKVSSRYVSGRSKAWLKVKCFAEARFTVIGWEPAKRGPASVLLARQTGGGLQFAGGAFVTLAADERDRFWNALKRLASAAPALTLHGHRSALWVRPELRVTAKFLKSEERLRHATLSRLL